MTVYRVKAKFRGYDRENRPLELIRTTGDFEDRALAESFLEAELEWSDVLEAWIVEVEEGAEV